ncbi:MAG: hypothetical protein J5835_07265 [Bacteroidales bacterium]|nr:hypothetical protein [Bacteroidales bacterium]
MLLSNFNILIYNSFGILEEAAYISDRDNADSYGTRLFKGETYTVMVAANLGYQLPRMSLEEALGYRYSMAYPDEYSRGIPMTAIYSVTVNEDSFSIPLERLMARIDVSLDKSGLDSDVYYSVTGLQIGACPSSAGLFIPSEEPGESFPEGFSKTGADAYPLETGKKVSLYMLENTSGSSYLVIKASYKSDSWHTKAGKALIYRVKLGPIERNHTYPIVIQPVGNGLGDGSDKWRIDTEGLEAQLHFDLHPAAYNECGIDDDFHIWCDVLPRGTPVTIEALSYEEDLRVADIYDYTIDPDGCGLTIHPRKSGSAVVYFSTGQPLLRDTLAMLVIKQ